MATTTPYMFPYTKTKDIKYWLEEEHPRQQINGRELQVKVLLGNCILFCINYNHGLTMALHWKLQSVYGVYTYSNTKILWEKKQYNGRRQINERPP